MRAPSGLEVELVDVVLGEDQRPPVDDLAVLPDGELAQGAGLTFAPGVFFNVCRLMMSRPFRF